MAQLTRRILGIDPGSLHLGLGLVEKRGNRVRLLFAETLHAPAKKEFFERLDYLHLRLRDRIEELKPDEVAVFAETIRRAIARADQQPRPV